MKKIGEGDRKALTEVVHRYQDFIYSCSMAKLRDAHLAEEVTQDVFIKLYRFSASFRGDSSLKTWLYKVCERACFDKIRQRNRHRTVEVDRNLDMQVSHNDGEISLLQEDRKAYIQQLVDHLDERSREVILLFYIEDLSIDEVADMLSLTVSNVKIILFRSRNKLKELVKTNSSKKMTER